jgi:hypothetical protein
VTTRSLSSIYQRLASFAVFLISGAHCFLQNMGSSPSLLLDNFRTSVSALMQSILHDGVHDVRPIDECACYNDNGTFNDDNFQDYLHREEEEGAIKRKFMFLLMDMIEAASLSVADMPDTNTGPPSKRSRRVQTFVDPTTGVVCPMTPHQSLWWMMYVQDPKVDDAHWNRLFRTRFRLPYNSFLELLQMMQFENFDPGNDIFVRWRERKDEDSKKKTRVSPMELLVLGSLRYLGRGWTFDDLEESTFISRDVHRVFFHSFVKFGAEHLYAKFVVPPSTIQELRECESEYRKAGFPGCIGSTDATHITLEKVRFGIRQPHLGFKSSQTTRTYNVTVNHRRKILHSTTGHPGRWNDKTLVRFDGLMHQLREGDLNSSMSFNLHTETGKQRTVKGCYVVVDNGYLQWPTTVPPYKHSTHRSELRFSQWLESLRKDVECTFGILKGRWRILKSGIRLHNTEVADNIWLTCCSLHNWLLDADGLSDGWQNGIPSHWETESGELRERDIPESIRKLMDPNGAMPFSSGYEGSYCGFVDYDRGAIDNSNVDDDNNGNLHMITTTGALVGRDNVSVNNLSLSLFRSMLVEHFNIAFHQHEVIWPKRLISKPRNIPC